MRLEFFTRNLQVLKNNFLQKSGTNFFTWMIWNCSSPSVTMLKNHMLSNSYKAKSHFIQDFGHFSGIKNRKFCNTLHLNLLQPYEFSLYYFAFFCFQIFYYKLPCSFHQFVQASGLCMATWQTDYFRNEPSFFILFYQYIIDMFHNFNILFRYLKHHSTV